MKNWMMYFSLFSILLISGCDFFGNQDQESEGGRFSEQSENSKDQDDDQDEREPHEDDSEHEKDSEHEDEAERAKQQKDDD
ncbi:hypothetical protein M5F00_04610 [Acinetobacter sp. ANC 4945]|uniref:Lipoprotein n=1 Tax=Acinetobacter amyesii TaxID=2942470 RepID=A0A1T1GWH1_9GAMM|nr:hypothetical protein [Acinetobacter amyesii]MCL6247145.1 hypothetical protein [Acinetobacter amyesii]OOV81956.1 hypothetical protein B1202_10990 [Acinetobacter amyesii]